MKKNIFSLGLAVISVLALTTNCAKNEVDVNPAEEEQEVVSTAIPFELSLNATQTKTTNDGMSTNWEDTDAVLVFHAEAGSTDYVKDGKFTVKDAATGIFEGTLASALDAEKSYDWYVLYPYYSGIESPANTDTGFTTVAPINSQTQTGNDSKAHLVNLPLAGKTTTAAGVSKPAINMNQLASVVKVVVTNNSGAPLPVTSVKITTAADTDIAGHEVIYISGNYYINFTNPAAPGFKAASSKSTAVTLNTSYGIPSLGTATFYVAVKPFTVLVGDKLKVKVNDFEKTLTITGTNKDFPAGKINTMNFNYDQTASVATLPFSIDGTGGSSAFTSTDGLSASGLGSNYAAGNSPYLTKFDDSGDYIQVCYDVAAAKATMDVKMLGGDKTSYIDVKGSSDGLDFTQIERWTVSGSQNDVLNFETSASISDTYRYIRFVFTKGSNVGVGPISITKPSTDPEIQAANISDVSVEGVNNTTASYTIRNFAGSDDVEVSAFDGSVVTSASVTSAGTITYTVAPNYSSGAANGSITLHSDNESLDKVITVTQLGESFATTATSTITLGKDATSATFTITTASFGWASVVTTGDGKNLTISPTSGSANASAQTITINSTTEATASEQTLGTIKLYRNDNASDEQAINITVKKASSGSLYYKKVTSITAGNTYLIVGNSSKAMPHPSTSAERPAGASVSVTASGILSNGTTNAYAFTVSASATDGYYLISYKDGSTTYYVTYNGSSTTIKSATSDTANNALWQFNAVSGDDAYGGSFRLNCKGASTRAIIYDSSHNYFGAFATSNLNGTVYYNVDLYELDD